MYALIIFDWDGTLVNSVAKIVASMRGALTEYSPAVSAQVSDRAIENIIGLALPEAIAVLCPEMNEDDIEQVRQGYVRHFLSLEHQSTPLFDGVRDGLSRLQQAGYELAVATGKARRGLDRMMDELSMRPFFVDSRCADETRSKPHPLMLEELLEARRIAPHQALMVGDTEYDLAMARAVDMASVGVRYGVHDDDRLWPQQPVMLVDRFTQLVDWLERREPQWRPDDVKVEPA